MLSLYSNILFAALEATAPGHDRARGFLDAQRGNDALVVCELVLVELYLLLRNTAVVANPLPADMACRLCQTLRQHPKWRLVENARVMDAVWDYAGRPAFARRRIIDVRLALTLQHHGVTEFATANTADFQDLGFARVWNPLSE